MTWFLINRYFLQARGRRNDRRYTSVFQCTVLCAHKAGTMVGYDEWGGTLRSNNFCHHQKFRLAKQIIAQCCMENFNVFLRFLSYKMEATSIICSMWFQYNHKPVHELYEDHSSFELTRFMMFKRSMRSLRGVIFKIQPLRNPSIFNNMICVLISKVLLMGMSNHPHFEIFWTSSKI